MKIFVRFVIILTISSVGISKVIDQKRYVFYARKLLGIDWCSLNCGEEKNIACELGGKCDPSQAPCKLEAIDKQKVLDDHNALRERFASGKETITGGLTVANMNALSWDNDLEFTAKCNLANCGGMAHDKCRTTPKFPTSAGQNLLSYSWSTTGYDCIENVGKRVETQWYDEIKLVSASQIIEDGKSYTFNHGTGHFTQVVWATVTHIGCALTKKVDGGKTSCFMACNYGPAGNLIGGSMFKEGKPCSDCPGGLKCGNTYKNLCGDGDGVKDAGGAGGAAELHSDIGLIIICSLFFHRFWLS